VAEAAHPEANIIFGAVIDDALGDEVRVTVIAAGFDAPVDRRSRPGAGSMRRTETQRVVDVRDEAARTVAAQAAQRPVRSGVGDSEPARYGEPRQSRDDPRQSRDDPRQSRDDDPRVSPDDRPRVRRAEPAAREPAPEQRQEPRPEPRRSEPPRRVVFDDLDVPDFLK